MPVESNGDIHGAWEPFQGAIFTVPHPATTNYICMLIAIDEVYEQSRKYVEWFDPDMNGELEILFAWSEVDAPTPGLVRHYKAKGDRPPRTTYQKAFHASSMHDELTDEVWETQLHEHDLAFAAIERRLALSPRPAPPTLAEVKAAYRPWSPDIEDVDPSIYDDLIEPGDSPATHE